MNKIIGHLSKNPIAATLAIIALAYIAVLSALFALPILLQGSLKLFALSAGLGHDIQLKAAWGPVIDAYKAWMNVDPVLRVAVILPLALGLGISALTVLKKTTAPFWTLIIVAVGLLALIDIGIISALIIIVLSIGATVVVVCGLAD